MHLKVIVSTSVFEAEQIRERVTIPSKSRCTNQHHGQYQRVQVQYIVQQCFPNDRERGVQELPVLQPKSQVGEPTTHGSLQPVDLAVVGKQSKQNGLRTVDSGQTYPPPIVMRPSDLLVRTDDLPLCNACEVNYIVGWVVSKTGQPLQLTLNLRPFFCTTLAHQGQRSPFAQAIFLTIGSFWTTAKAICSRDLPWLLASKRMNWGKTALSYVRFEAFSTDVADLLNTG